MEGREGAAALAEGLARRICRGEADAESELVETYGRGLRFFLLRLTADRHLADDLYQETFRVVIGRLRGTGLEDPAALPAFLRGTARHLLLNERHKLARRRTQVGLPSEDAVAADRVLQSAPSPLEGLLQKEKAAMVRRLIAELGTERDRQILFRTYIAEEPRQAICEDLGLGSEHFHRVLHRARQRLKEMLAAHGLAGRQSAGERPGPAATASREEASQSGLEQQ